MKHTRATTLISATLVLLALFVAPSLAQLPVAPAITTQPSSVSVNDHQAATFTVAASGTPAPTIQWQDNNGVDQLWTNIPGATTTTLSISSHLVDRLSNQGWCYRAVATNDGGQAISTAACITINTPPEIVNQNRTVSGYNNGFVSMATIATGSPAPTVQWTVSSDRGVSYVPVTGTTSANSPTLTLRVTSAMDGYFFRATYTNIAGTDTSDDILLVVPLYSPPLIFLPPQSQTAVLGTDVTFTVDYMGGELPTLQWQEKTTLYNRWINIDGATSSSYTKTVTELDRNAQFRVIATNRLGVDISLPATLTVPALTPPAIITQPAFAGRTTWGTIVTLVTRASGSPAPTAQWFRTFNPSTTFVPIGTAGATLPTLTFIAQPNDTQSSFQVVYTNAAGSVTSTPYKLVLSTSAAPLIEQQPVPITAQDGDTAVFNVLVSGSPFPAVQWQVSNDGGFTYTNITGAFGPTLSVLAVANPANHKLYYRALANNTLGFAFSQPAYLTVVRPSAPIITRHPASQEVPVGKSVVFETETVAYPPATFQWQSSSDGVNFSPIVGATFPTLQFTAVAATQQNTYYRLVATNKIGVATSSAALLTVYSPNAPVITVQPKPKNVLTGSTIALVAVAVGSPAPTVQWYSRSAADAEWVAIPGATQYTYTFVADSFQQYRAVFSNTDGTANSAIATVNVYGRLYRVSQSAASTLHVGLMLLLALVAVFAF